MYYFLDYIVLHLDYIYWIIYVFPIVMSPKQKILMVLP